MTLVETAQLTRAPVQRVADAVAQCFVPTIVALSLMTWMAWFLLVYTFNVPQIDWKSRGRSHVLQNWTGRNCPERRPTARLN